MSKPSKGAMRASEKIRAIIQKHEPYHYLGISIIDAATIIDAETHAEDMAEAIEGLLDYHRRIGATSFQYEKLMDHIRNMQIALDKYRVA